MNGSAFCRSCASRRAAGGQARGGIIRRPAADSSILRYPCRPPLSPRWRWLWALLALHAGILAWAAHDPLSRSLNGFRINEFYAVALVTLAVAAVMFARTGRHARAWAAGGALFTATVILGPSPVIVVVLGLLNALVVGTWILRKSVPTAEPHDHDDAGRHRGAGRPVRVDRPACRHGGAQGPLRPGLRGRAAVASGVGVGSRRDPRSDASWRHWRPPRKHRAPPSLAGSPSCKWHWSSTCFWSRGRKWDTTPTRCICVSRC